MNNHNNMAHTHTQMNGTWKVELLTQPSLTVTSDFKNTDRFPSFILFYSLFIAAAAAARIQLFFNSTFFLFLCRSSHPLHARIWNMLIGALNEITESHWKSVIV